MISIDEYFNLPKKITIFMIYTKLFVIILLAQSILVFDCLASDNPQNAIVDFVKSFVKANIALPVDGRLEISVPAIDPRINIKPCLSKLNANIPENHNGRNVNVKIVCNDPTPWQLYIPVKVSQTIPVLVATTVLVKGTVIDESNTIVEYRRINSIRGENLSNIASVAGGRLKRRLSKGGIVSPRNICLVCKGETVTIIATSNDFTIKTSGLALSDGSIGEQVRVKNSRSGRTISARVQSINKVLINL
jgi:flagella basal body P-ring formation protein FlgA